MDRNHLYRYCEHCEEFISARTFLRHKEAYYDDHTRIWSKDCQSVPSTSEDEGDDGGAIQLNSGSDNSEGLSDDEMDNSTAELQATEDCLEDEVDDGEVWEGVNVSEIEGRFSSFVAQMTTIFPTSIIGLHSCLNVNSNDFRRLVSCPKCHTLYEFEKCFVDKAKMIPKVCSFSKFPNHPHRSRRQHCGSQLLRAVVTKDGDHKFYPLKVYCYKPLIESLQTLLSKPGVLNSCEHWRERKIPKDTLCDIYDGKIWEEFQYVNGSAFLAAPHNIGLMMNVDWFTPFKHTPYSVGAVYLSVMNLPRSKRFLKENMILFGLIPGPNEPPLNINSYLEPLVEELKVLWSEGMVINMPDNPGQQVHLKAGLLCVACDIPAARKVCGFLGHMAKLGCSKCTKEFHINCETGHACFGCFDDGEDESPLRNESDHREQADLASMQTTQAARDRIESQYGSRFTALMLLEYFDCVRFHIVDPMHNLFLGTAKHIMKNVWLDDIEPIIPKRFHAMMQEKVDKCETPSSMGRIPHKIASSFSSFTADQWKTWTMVFSMYALHGVLEQEHLECWYLFVQACNILVSPMLKIHDAMEGHKLLLQFCKQFQRLYGKDKVTPNMHMHMHILNCILDYGPVYAFWLFSFERYNGILGSYRTNNRSIEVQLMRHFVQEMEIGKLHIRDENYTAHSIVQELDQTAAVVGTLNDMLAQNSNSHLEIQTASRLPACEFPDDDLVTDSILSDDVCAEFSDDHEDVLHMDDGDGDDGVNDGGDGDDDGAFSLEDHFEDLDRENVGSYSPFPSKLFALLFILVNSPHPMGEKNLSFVWFILKQLDMTVPSLASVKAFKLPNMEPPMRGNCKDVLTEIEPLLNVEQFQQMVPTTTVTHMALDSAILHEKAVVTLADIICLATPPRQIVRMASTDSGFVRMDLEETAAYFSQHPLKVKAAGKRILMLPLILFSDDTSGGPIAQELTMLETEGTFVFDALYQEMVLVLAPLLCIVCDNPRASELLNHLGSAAIKFCRICMTSRTESPDMVCVKRTKAIALQQITDILAQRTESERVEQRKAVGLREDDNPLLTMPADLYESTPVEVLHTLLLGTCKHILKILMPKFSAQQKREILARIRAFNTSGFNTKMYGNVCQYYQSFVGRDFKGWAQMCLFILGPYLNEGDSEVLLAFTKVFQIAYCDIFKASSADSCRNVCQAFVDSAKRHMPTLLDKQKTHLLLHLVDCMVQFGPSSAFSAERCGIDLKHIYSMPLVQHLLCGTSMQEIYEHRAIYQQGAPRKVSRCLRTLSTLRLVSVGRQNTTLDILLQCGIHYDLVLGSVTLTERVTECGAVMSQERKLVNSGDFIEAVTSQFEVRLEEIFPTYIFTQIQMQYGILLATFKRNDGSVHCLVQGFQKLETTDGQAIKNSYDCPLLELSRTIFCTPSSNVRRAVSLVHECSDSCAFLETTAVDNVEREEAKRTLQNQRGHRKSTTDKVIQIYSLYEPKDSECKVGLKKKKALNLLLALLYGFCSLQLARRFYFLITKYCIENHYCMTSVPTGQETLFLDHQVLYSLPSPCLELPPAIQHRKDEDMDKEVGEMIEDKAEEDKDKKKEDEVEEDEDGKELGQE
ncbi:hypothetical protein EMCRGX_G015323 [Ephydatia muelleri]